MGGVCSAGSGMRKVKAEKTVGFSGKLNKVRSSKQKENSQSCSKTNRSGKSPEKHGSVEHSLSVSGKLKHPKSAKNESNKATPKKSFLGKAGIGGLDRAVEVLDTLGSSMSNLNGNNSFISGIAPRGHRISILAFEVANTIVKGANLLQSVSEESIQFLKKDILQSEGVKKLVSTDVKELLIIAAADKREELDIFSREVVRFGNHCKDPQLHKLGRLFSGLDSKSSSNRQQRSEAESTMQQLTILAQHTSELYHELNTLDRFEQDYRRKLEELKALNLPRKGESLTILQSEFKQQRKLVRSLKKKSLWSRNLEEIVEKLVDVVTYIHQAILEAFGNNGRMLVGKEEPGKVPERLGVAGLALHYANIINQIDNIASRPSSLPPNTRDTLYQGLPESVKASLRSRLHAFDAKEELSVSLIKAEMEKTFKWLVPVATNTNKAHQGFGWVGEWANSGPEFGKTANAHNNLVRLQTLYHADKQKTDQYVLELVTWLHHLIRLVRNRDHEGKPQPMHHSPIRKGPKLHPKMQRFVSLDYRAKTSLIQLSREDKKLLEEAIWKKRVLGVSKSQEFPVGNKGGGRVLTRCRSAGSSPCSEARARQNLGHPMTDILDVMDGLNTMF